MRNENRVPEPDETQEEGKQTGGDTHQDVHHDESRENEYDPDAAPAKDRQE
jgi:hypothetical protein